MDDKLYIKNKLLEACSLFVDNRNLTVSTIMASAKKDLQTETKSSAGDKHETGRAMLQLEMEKASQQLVVISAMHEVLRKIDPTNNNGIAKLGSLIYTSQGNYFLAISVGQVSVSNKDYYVVSATSPIGKLLLGKQKGDTFLFNGKVLEVVEIY